MLLCIMTMGIPFSIWPNFLCSKFLFSSIWRIFLEKRSKFTTRTIFSVFRIFRNFTPNSFFSWSFWLFSAKIQTTVIKNSKFCIVDKIKLQSQPLKKLCYFSPFLQIFSPRPTFCVANEKKIPSKKFQKFLLYLVLVHKIIIFHFFLEFSAFFCWQIPLSTTDAALITGTRWILRICSQF